MTHRFRSLAWPRTPGSPGELLHHAVRRDADARLFDAMLRHLRQRLYDGRVANGAAASGKGAAAVSSVRSATLRQGGSPRLAAGLLVAGGAMLVLSLLAGRALGRDPDRHTRDGGGMPAAVLAAVRERAPEVAIAAAATLAIGVFVGYSPRKHVWLVAYSGREPETIDLWMAGVGACDAAAFATEFEVLVADAARLQALLAAPPADAVAAAQQAS